MTFDSQTVGEKQMVDLLIVFTDLVGFARHPLLSANLPELGQILDTHFEMVGAAVARAGGRFLKCMGDGSLSVFPEEKVDAAVQAMVELKRQSDQWFAGQKYNCPVNISMHFGPVLYGPFGPQDKKQIDVLGTAVNTAVVLKTQDIALTPQVFRKLEPATRQLFKKHTPPIRYIPVGSSHQD